VRLTAPAGARAARVRVFRLSRGGRQVAAGGPRARRTLLASVVRRVVPGRRTTVRLTHRALRHLRPGRYLVEVRVGRSRADLGAATTRVVRVRR
jgi:hypothetical protein